MGRFRPPTDGFSLVTIARRFSPLACLALCLLAPPLWLALSPAPALAQDAQEKTEPLTIVSANGHHTFDVEVMRTEAQRSRGLMYRRTMAANHGMLFNFDAPQTVTMWMKNTYLSLDMVFIRTDGTIARIAAETEPLSTKIIPSNEPVLAVLELVGGTAGKLGIRPGDRIEHAMFKVR